MWFDYSLIVLGAFLGAMVAGSAGFAFALVGAAVWLHVLPPIRVVTLAVICSMLLHGALIWRLRHHIQKRLLWPFLAGALIGVPLGVAALQRINAAKWQTAVGILLVAYSLYMLTRVHLPVLRLATTTGKTLDGAVGLLGGFMGGATSLNGLFPTLWCGLRGWNKTVQRGIYQPFILLAHAYTLLWLGGIGSVSRQSLIDALICLPALTVGGLIGLRLFHFVSEDVFRRLVLWLFLLSGITLIFR